MSPTYMEAYLIGLITATQWWTRIQKEPQKFMAIVSLGENG